VNALLALPADGGHALFQRDFADAIFFDDAGIPATVRSASGPASASRFGVYRNNVIAGLIKAVAARYPVVRKLLWDDAFNRIARLYVTAEPPRSPVLLEYGAGFPQFLRRIGQGSSADYLADVGELEAARTRAYHAADAMPVSRDILSRIAPHDLPHLRLTLHPSFSLLNSRFPVVTIWESNVHDNDNAITQWKQESALIARPRLGVDVWRLSRGAFEFLTAIRDRQTIGSAIAHAAASGPDFDLAECFEILVAADIVTGIERSTP
jgi:hypothetical protein